jgi:threonine synthase
VIRYLDTRSSLRDPLPFADVILQGIAPGGGLFVPERLPALTPAEIEALAGAPYWERVARVFERFELGLSAERVAHIAKQAYGANFDHPEIAPVVQVGDGRFVLELWHGPTLAFKDMALQCMPLFFSEAVEEERRAGGAHADYLVLVATSGDTGVAALSGFADRAHTKIAVCYPRGGVSAIQQRQMITQPGGNLTVFAVEGDFDDCQRCVKAVFADEGFCAGLLRDYRLRLSSANSINWGRLLPQIVYYVSAYADLVAGGHRRMGEPIDVCVPSGNFGNLLAAYYAKRLGTPIARLLCASNANKVLTDFLATGRYDLADRRLVKTASPSMDILVSSNLERLLYQAAGDGRRVQGWMRDLRDSGSFELDPATYARVQGEFIGDWVDNETCVATIGRVYREHGYLIDPHTAVAWEVADRHRGDVPMLVVSPAHWAKFPADVVRGLRGLEPGAPLPGDEVDLLSTVAALAPGHPAPATIREVCSRPVRFTGTVENDPAALERELRGWLDEA